VACNIKHITDEMFLTAAKCLAGQVAEADLNKGCIYPSLKNIRDMEGRP
jgi:malate dehydrogenase (oxaloacetate-decarboxylating)(NADP+)